MADYSNQSGYTACQTDEYGNPIKQTGTKGDYGTTTGAHGTTPGAGGVYGGGEQQQQQKKGVMEKIKEKLPGGKTDDYGNPIQQTGTKGDYGTNTGTTGTHGTHTGTTGTTGAYGTHTGGEPYQQHEKKGVMEKVKEKLPGGQTDECGNPIKKTGTMGDYLNTTGTTGAHGTHTGTTGTTGGYGGEQQHEKKGLMEKVKEKLPGGQTDEYGNSIKQTGTKGDYLNTTGTTGAHGTHTGTTGTTGGYGGEQQQQHEKKGLMEKVKEKLPGGQTDEYGNPIKQTGTKGDYGTTTGTTGAYGTHTGTTDTTGGYGEQQQQKKGMMEKIKEKLPGQHN